MNQQVKKAQRIINTVADRAINGFGDSLQKAGKIEFTLEQFTDYTRSVAMDTYRSVVTNPENTHQHYEGGLYRMIDVANPAGKARHAGLEPIVVYRGTDEQLWYRASVEEFNKSFKPIN